MLLSTEIPAALAPLEGATAATCPVVLEELYTRLETLDPRAADPADLGEHGAELVGLSWTTRLALHERLRGWAGANELTAPCMRSLRRADLALRYLEDYLLEALPPAGRPAPWLAAPGLGFDGRDDLRSGDVLVTRATALSSAGIAHMGRVDSQFSHNVLVYVDPAGRAWGVMAYLEEGSLVEPIDEFLADSIGRVVVLRHPDQALAEKAAKLAYARVVDGPPIDYDADFDADDHATLFCSEVPRWAFGPLVGAPDAIPIDLALTRFDQDRNRAMFAAMGIDGAVTSAPSDVLYDPTFDWVAEWRAVDDLALMRRHDAVVESAMTWMEELGYTLEPRRGHERFVEVALAVRRAPLVGGALRKRIHPRGDLRFLVGALALQEAVTAVSDDLVTALGDRPEPLAYDTLRAVLEEVRTADLARWRDDPRSAHFTDLLRPGDGAAAGR